jgi:hypothetical protein
VGNAVRKELSGVAVFTTTAISRLRQCRLMADYLG